MFDWVAFLESEGIHFVREGRNVKRGNVNIPCPFCGSSDPSEHMGLSLTTGYWGCLRDASHRGKDPARLIQILKGCDKQTAEDYAKSDSLVGSATLHDLAKRAAALDKAVRTVDPQTLEMPGEFRLIRSTGLTSGAFDYLCERKFQERDVPYVVSRYGLRYATSGEWKGRIIIPLIKNKKLLGWTGRSIARNPFLRYKSYPEGDVLKQLIWNYDGADRGGNVLVINEGPFDGLKIDTYDPYIGTNAIALLTAAATPAKLAQIIHLAKKHKRTVILLDRAAVSQAQLLASQLALAGAEVRSLIDVKDPGEMTKRQVHDLGLSS